MGRRPTNKQTTSIGSESWLGACVAGECYTMPVRVRPYRLNTNPYTMPDLASRFIGGLRTTLLDDMTMDIHASENDSFVGTLNNLIGGGTYTIKATFTAELSNYAGMAHQNYADDMTSEGVLPTRIRLRVVAVAINGKPCKGVWLTGHDAVTLDEQKQLLSLRNQLLNKLSDAKNSEPNSPAVRDFADRLK